MYNIYMLYEDVLNLEYNGSFQHIRCTSCFQETVAFFKKQNVSLP